MRTDAITRAATFLADRDHALAFLGPIGVGKTTGLSTVCGISMDGNGDPIDRILLKIRRRYDDPRPPAPIQPSLARVQAVLVAYQGVTIRPFQQLCGLW